MISPWDEFHPWIESAPASGQTFFLYTCSTEVKSHPYPYFAPVFKTEAKLTPGVIRHDFNV